MENHLELLEIYKNLQDMILHKKFHLFEKYHKELELIAEEILRSKKNMLSINEAFTEFFDNHKEKLNLPKQNTKCFLDLICSFVEFGNHVKTINHDVEFTDIQEYYDKSSELIQAYHEAIKNFVQIVKKEQIQISELIQKMHDLKTD